MRLDIYVSEQMNISRTRASEFIKGGKVRVDGKEVTKPSFEVCDNEIDINTDEDAYVSRGAKKLLCALDCFKIDVAGLTCADLGASTGGFCEVLIGHGAKKIYAVDIGHGQLHPKIENDARVVSLEGVNARYIDDTVFGEKVDIVTADLSFISQTLVFEAICRVLKPQGRYIGLIKPQFEAGRENIAKGGIVKDKKVHRHVIKKVIESANTYGLVCESIVPSPILGGDGNREFLAVYIYRGEPGIIPGDKEIAGILEKEGGN